MFRNMTVNKFFMILVGVIALLIFGAHNSDKPTETIEFTYLYSSLALAIAIWIIVHLYLHKCKKCGKWGCMKIFNKEIVDERASTIKKTLRHNDGRGNVRTETVLVPATVYIYHHHRRCQKCDHVDYVIRKKKKAD